MAEKYHHGDLRVALIAAAAEQLAQLGLEQLTLRKLSDKVGVSRTGAYHHFANKNELVCAVAVGGFEQLMALTEAAAKAASGASDTGQGLDLHRVVSEYLAFAEGQPELYELMFGRTIWKVGEATAQLKTVSHASFELYAGLIAQALGERQPEVLDRQRCLRIAQTCWALLHGLCRLFLDGVYLASSDRVELIDEAVMTLELVLSSPRAVGSDKVCSNNIE